MKHPQYPNLELIEPNYSREQRAKAAKLLRQGLSFSVVGRELGVHRDTIKNWGQHYDPELGNAGRATRQLRERERSLREAEEHLRNFPPIKPPVPVPPCAWNVIGNTPRN